ncbi:hypothetical protein [Burkholderia glumae]|uniref:phosphatase domain-containing protein n=1 Tax=Burkholderia glumae TaxID=337 RepID=UPI00157A89D7|nr:hypothetical protein [Burkholderia glumae]
MASKPLYIFDLDGTLALIDHRRHFVEGRNKDWRAFFAACIDDAPNVPVIKTLQQLRASGAEIWIWSGRSDEVRTETVKWLCENGCFGGTCRTLPAWPFGAPERFRMRSAGDQRSDVELKSQWLSEVEPPEYQRLTAVFDDRDSVVAMWRAAGISCFQVAPGGF